MSIDNAVITKVFYNGNLEYLPHIKKIAKCIAQSNCETVQWPGVKEDNGRFEITFTSSNNSSVSDTNGCIDKANKFIEKSIEQIKEMPQKGSLLGMLNNITNPAGA